MKLKYNHSKCKSIYFRVSLVWPTLAVIIDEYSVHYLGVKVHILNQEIEQRWQDQTPKHI